MYNWIKRAFPTIFGTPVEKKVIRRKRLQMTTAEALEQAYWQSKFRKLSPGQKLGVANYLGCAYTTILHKISGRRKFTQENIDMLKAWKTGMCK